MQILSIDNAVRKNTGSTDFFLNRLSRHKVVLDYNSDFRELLTKMHFDLVFFWQGLPDLKDTSLLRKHNTWLVPMWDQVKDADRSYWAELTGLRFLSFSSHLTKLLEGYGLCYFDMQYFPVFQAIAKPRNAVLFWRRSEHPDLADFDLLFSRIDIDALYYRDDVEKNPEIPERLERKIERFWKSDSRVEYTELLSKSKYMLASRYSEGIGLSFLEAMSHSVCVVASNDATMNEYIRNQHNGYIYEKGDPFPIEFLDFDLLHAGIEETMTQGRRIYEGRIADFEAACVGSYYNGNRIRQCALIFLGLPKVVMRRMKWFVSSILAGAST